MLTSEPPDTKINISGLTALSANAVAVMQQLRKSMLAPTSKKKSPRFSSGQLADLCGLEKNRFNYLLNKTDLPLGEKIGSRREWTLAEALTWIRHFHADKLRDPRLSNGVVVAVANFKGGVGKTSLTCALAQGLSLRGHKVLVIDTDPQGSLTTLFGVLPDTDVDETDTILPLLAGVETSIMSAVRPTYWDGIDLVAAAPLLNNAELLLPERQMHESDFEFWSVLDDGLESAREIYDVIIIDTPPSLSYLTLNALIAAQGIVMPLPPNALDFASSTQFWNLFTEVCGDLHRKSGGVKEYAFLDVLLTRVDKADAVSAAVKQWIIKAYGRNVLQIEIPKTSTAATASAEFGTVYDMDPTGGQAKSLKRAIQAYDQFVDHIAFQISVVWAADAKLMMKV